MSYQVTIVKITNKRKIKPFRKKTQEIKKTDNYSKISSKVILDIYFLAPNLLNDLIYH